MSLLAVEVGTLDIAVYVTFAVIVFVAVFVCLMIMFAILRKKPKNGSETRVKTEKDEINVTINVRSDDTVGIDKNEKGQDGGDEV